MSILEFKRIENLDWKAREKATAGWPLSKLRKYRSYVYEGLSFRIHNVLSMLTHDEKWRPNCPEIYKDGRIIKKVVVQLIKAKILFPGRVKNYGIKSHKELCKFLNFDPYYGMKAANLCPHCNKPLRS